MRSEKEKMLAGELFVAECPALAADFERANDWMHRYNSDLRMGTEQRLQMLRELLRSVGDRTFVRPPFYCDFGSNIILGNGVFINFGCVILDIAQVSIGCMTQIGPAAQILTADHPRDPAQRRQRLEFGRPINIGCNVWIGAGALIMPGVTISDDAIVGAGAVVTRDVPAGATVVGNPARLARTSNPTIVDKTKSVDGS